MDNQIFHKPLEFGNVEQIREIRRLEKESEESEKLKIYEVEISFSGSTVFEVKANNEEEAREMAQEETIDWADHIDDCDVESVKCLGLVKE